MTFIQGLNHNAPKGASEKIRAERLEDVNSKGKARPWVQRKRQSIAVAKAFEVLGGSAIKSYERITQCGSFLQFAQLAHNSTGEIRLRLRQANFCQHRLCPMCQWRRSIILHEQLCEVVGEHLKEAPRDRALLLTLTMQNCEPDALNATISEMTNAFRRLSDMAPVRRSVVGWFRSLEVTRNREDGSYHPHLHVLLMVPPEYFDQGRDLYLETRDWVALWRKALRVDYDPICDVRRVGKGNKGGLTDAMRKGLVEVTKYCTKPADWIEYVGGVDGYTVEPKVVAELLGGLRSKRLVGWGGTLKEIREEMQLQDIEAEGANLVGDDDDVPEGWQLLAVIDYNWRGRRADIAGDYFVWRTTQKKTGPPDPVPKAA